MNALCYKIVFSKRLGALVAVGEHTAGQGKAAGTGVRSMVFPSSAASAASGEGFVGALKTVFASVALTCFTAAAVTAAPGANTLPTGYSVNSGNVAVSTSGANMTIKQTTDKASVNWQSFSIGSAAAVNIQQNSASSVLLNRVVGNDPSQIFGKLTANGQVILINPNGIVFGKGGSVTASAFTASTFGMTEEDFKKGKYKYSRNGSTAGVTVEEGASINTTVPGGYIALIASTVSNHGNLAAKQGPVIMAAAETVTLPSNMTDSVGIPLSGKVRLELDPSTITASVENGGTITTEGGQVLMQAAAVVDAVASVTHTGSIDTTGAQGGGVTLLAENGHIKFSGSITANSNGNDSQGRANQGGNIIIGRDEDTGVLAANTDVSGAQLQSKGGFIETSGEYLKTDGVSIKAAQWLLDPSDITISSAANSNTTGTPPTDITPNGASGTSSVVNVSTIQNAINAGTNVTIKTTNASNTTGAGNITIANALTFNNAGATDATLSLIADNGIMQNTGASITTSAGSAKLVNVIMTANGNFQGNVATSTSSQGMALNSTITTNGSVTLTGTTSSNAGSGVAFNNNSGINAGSFTVTGNNTSTTGGSWPNPNGVRIQGSVNFTTTGLGKITGNTQDSQGYSTLIGSGTTLGLNANSGGAITLDTAANSLMGMRIGFSGGATINTNGNVTIGSKSGNATSVYMQGVINAQSGALTLQGQNASGSGITFVEGGGSSPKVTATNGATVTIDGNSTGGGGFGVYLGYGVAPTIISSDTGAISITGTSSVSTGIYSSNTQASTISSTSGSITLTGTANGAANSGVGLNLSNGGVTTTGAIQLNGSSVSNVAILNNATITGGSVTATGIAATGSGFANSGTITATGDINLTGTSTTGGNTGFFSGTAIASNHGSVTITGTSATGGGAVIQGTVTAQNNVTINGTSSSTSSSNQGVVIQNAIKATTGDITVTGNTNSGVQRAVAITANGAVNGSLQTLAANRNININADTLLINTASSVDASSTGTVNIKTTSGNAIALGSGDTINSTASSRVLGLDQGELNVITAGKLNVGSTTGGNVTVATGITTASTSGDLALLSGGNVAINAALTVGGASATKNLTLNSAGATSAITQSAAIKAAGLELLGANATYTLTNTGNDIKKLAGNTKTVSLVNNAAFAINTVNTVGLTASSKTTLNSTAAVTQTQALTTPSLELLGTGGSYTLTNTSNAVTTLAANTGGVNFVDASALSVGTVNATNGITSTGDITLKTLTGNLALNSSVQTKVNGNVDLSTDNGTLTASTNVTAAGTGSIKLTGINQGTTGHGMSLNGGLITALGGDVHLKGTTSSTTNGTAGIFSNATVNAKNIYIDAKALADTSTYRVLGYYGAGGTYTATGLLDLQGSTNTAANGFYSYSDKFTAATGITVVGTSKYGQGVGFENSAELNNTTSGSIQITGTATDTSKQAIGLQGSSITNSGGDIVLKALSGNIVTGTGPLNSITGQSVWGGAPRTNTITSNGTGAIKIMAAGNTPSASDTGAIDGTTLSVIQNGNGGVEVSTSGQGNLIASKITNAGTGNVTVAAGTALAAGDGSGGQVKTVAGNTISQTNVTPGKTYIYTGNATDTGSLANLGAFGSDLYLSTIGANTQNAASNQAYGSTVTNGASAQVLFREKVAINGTFNDATITYGNATDAAAVKAALAEANHGTFSTSSNAGNFKILSKDILSDAGTTTNVDAALSVSTNKSSSGNLKASTTGYDIALAVNNYTMAPQSNKLIVDKRDLTGVTIGSVSGDYGRGISSGAVDLSGSSFVTGDIVRAYASAVFDNATDLSTSGNLKQGTYYQQLDRISNVLGKTDADNYNITSNTTNTKNYEVKKLVVTGVTIDAGGTDYGGALKPGAVNFTNSNINSDDVVYASAAVVSTNGDLSTSGNLKAGSYAQKVSALTNGNTNNDAENYTFSAVTNANSYTVAKRDLTAIYTANDKIFDGTTKAVVAGSVASISGDNVVLSHDSSNFSDASIGNGKTVTVGGLKITGHDVDNYTLTNTNQLATTKASITAPTPKPPTPAPIQPTKPAKADTLSNPFQLASAEDLEDDRCSANALQNCHCEESSSSSSVSICYEPNAGSK